MSPTRETETPFRREEILFEELEPHERVPCLVYELARESPTLRRAIEVHYRDQDPACKEERHAFQMRWPILGLWCSDWSAFLLWDGSPESETKRKQQRAPCQGESLAEDRLPVVLSTPYQCLNAEERLKIIPHPYEGGIFRPETSDPIRQHISAEGKEYTPICIDWANFTNLQLAKAFGQWVGLNRPPTFPGPKYAGRGHAAATQRAALWLRKLAACRLLSRYPNRVSVPAEFRDVWFLNPNEMRENCASLRSAYSEYITELELENEIPDCLRRCEELGRLTPKIGRPPKA